MDMSDMISLIPVRYTDDAIGQQTATELPPRKIFCAIESVSSTEQAEAGRNGLKNAIKAIVYRDEYQSEELAEAEGEKYKIYRTYQKSKELLELYLGQKAGI